MRDQTPNTNNDKDRTIIFNLKPYELTYWVSVRSKKR